MCGLDLERERGCGMSPDIKKWFLSKLLLFKRSIPDSSSQHCPNEGSGNGNLICELRTGLTIVFVVCVSNVGGIINTGKGREGEIKEVVI